MKIAMMTIAMRPAGIAHFRMYSWTIAVLLPWSGAKRWYRTSSTVSSDQVFMSQRRLNRRRAEKKDRITAAMVVMSRTAALCLW